jgi:hypothetical protein
LRATRRRQRRPDPLATPEAVRAVLASLKSALSKELPDKEKKLVALLRAARHVQRYPATDTKRGRPSKYDRTLLIKVASRLSEILARETSSKVGLASFVDHYLRLLEFPSDVLDALRAGDINLFEAAQLARLTSDRLGVSGGAAAHTRRGLLRSHLAARGSTSLLRLRVNKLLSDSTATAADGEPSADVLAEDLELLDDSDPTHLLYDMLRQLVIALRTIEPDDVGEEELDGLLQAGDPLLLALSKVQRRKERKASKLTV